MKHINWYTSLFMLVSLSLVMMFQNSFAQEKKIVALLPVRNEELLIEQCLRALACYADAIVVLDDASDDSTLEIVHRLKDECKIEVILTKDRWIRDEPGDRKRLFEVGRSIGGTHFICIDADEMFTANCMNNNCLRNYILDLQPGESLAIYWIQLWRSVDYYRFDSSVWTYNTKRVIFCDTPEATYTSEQFHMQPAPQMNGKKKRLESYAYGLMHFQFVHWDNLLIKQAWYRCLERIKAPQKSIAEINSTYKPSKDEIGLKLRPSKKEWFEGYTFFEPSHLTTQESWRTKQVLGWFEQYGTDFFKDLDIWDIDWYNLNAALINRLRSIKINICTAADSKYFDHLINLIGSLHKVNYNELNELVVFDLGLTQDQVKKLASIEKVSVHSIEIIHPNILKQVVVNKDGKTVPGWYAWKPVILHQMLQMHDDYIYMDAGTTILKPLNIIYAHILEKGYFLVDCGHSINRMVTQRVMNYFDLQKPENRWILDESIRGCAGGFIGITKKIYENFVKKMYELANHIELFEDDGTAQGKYNGTSITGFGCARHDQPLFSILARKIGLEIFLEDDDCGDGRVIPLNIENDTTYLHMTWNKKWVLNKTTVYHSRDVLENFDYFSQFIRYKRNVR